MGARLTSTGHSRRYRTASVGQSNVHGTPCTGLHIGNATLIFVTAGRESYAIQQLMLLAVPVTAYSSNKHIAGSMCTCISITTCIIGCSPRCKLLRLDLCWEQATAPLFHPVNEATLLKHLHHVLLGLHMMPFLG